MSFFSATDLQVGYGSQTILKGISFAVECGNLMGIIGANGSGKTTLLKAICGILPHKGICQLENAVLEKQSPKQLARLCSYIPQRSGISIDISALDVVLMGFNPHLKLLKHPSEAMRKQAMQALSQVGFQGKEHVNYLHLSEGQKQLCILARTLAADSRLLLLDEPESSLDFRFRYKMLEILRSWKDSGQRAGIIALHDPVLALNFCDQLLFIHDGKILGTVHPRTDPLKDTEQLLSCIYGPISLQLCNTQNGKSQIVMLKEDEI